MHESLNSSLDQSFRHRENQDGTWDSICMRCYLTAAHSYREQPLASVEVEHHCDEDSWLFKEAAARARHFAAPGRSCPASAKPRTARPVERVQFGYPRLRGGLPAGLREQCETEASCAY